MPTLKKKRYLLPIFSLAVVLAVNLYFRAFPIYLPQLKDLAVFNAKAKLREKAQEQINKSFPQYSASAKNSLVSALFLQEERAGKKELKKEIHDEYLKLKDRYQDESGHTYLLELDCWHWAKYVENVLFYGHPGDKVVAGQQFDSLQCAPVGKRLIWNHFLFYLSAFLYKAFCFFKPVPLFTFLFYLPLFFAAIFIIALYLICFYRWGSLAAVSACLFVGLSPIFIARSCAGWFDMDVLNLLFPLLISWTYIKAYSCPSLKLRLSWVFLSSLLVGLFSYTWTGWLFIFCIIILYEIYSLLNLLSGTLQHKEREFIPLRLRLLVFPTFVFFSLCWILILSGAEPLKFFISQIQQALSLNQGSTSGFWPNTFSTVSEFQKPSISSFNERLGGAFIAVFSCLSILSVYLIVSRERKTHTFDREFLILMVLWWILMVFVTLKGIRFTMFLILPFGISAGYLVSYLNNLLKKRWLMLCMAAFLCFLLFGVIGSASRAMYVIYPLIDDYWYRLLVDLRKDTPKGSIINSWWDYGDWFKVISNRGVIFDGQSQDTPQAYWMGRVILSDNEEEAVAILRMLNNAGNKPFDVINAHLRDPMRSMLLLKKAISSGRKEAEESLSEALLPSAAKEITGMLFDRPVNKVYFIVDYSLGVKLRAISYLGNWDFLKAYLALNYKKKQQSKAISYLVGLGYQKPLLEELYNEIDLMPPEYFEEWVSKRLHIYSDIQNGQKNGEVVLFGGGLVYDVKEDSIRQYSCYERSFKVPKGLFIMEKGTIRHKVFPEGQTQSSVLLLKNATNYQSLILDADLANSLFMRLYFTDGDGLKYFRLFKKADDAGSLIKVYEVDWGK